MTDSENTTSQLMTLENLKDLGIDFKINKSDILDMLVEQARMTLTEQRDAAKDEYFDLKEEYNILSKEEQKAHWKSELKKVQSDDSVKQLKASLEDYYDIQLKVVLDGQATNYFLVPKDMKLEKSSAYSDHGGFRLGFCRSPREMYFHGPWALFEEMNRISNNVILPLNREPAKYKKSKALKKLEEKRSEAKKVYDALEKKFCNFSYDASRARIKVLRDFLGLTSEGQKLLGLLDSRRTGKQIISALKKDND